ncbi:TRAP transporter small permease [Alcaligenaceae bacterium]|nr:TRAP transporter small permease [Alcaligenaceae bacterium]
MNYRNSPTEWAAVIAGMGIVALMLLTVADVLLRKLTGQGVPGTVEYSEVILASCVFMGLAIAEQSGANVKTNLMTSRLSPGRRRAFVMPAIAACLFFMLLLIYATGMNAYDSVLRSESRFGLIRVPIWPARVALTLGLVLMLTEYLVNVRRKRPQDPIQTI